MMRTVLTSGSILAVIALIGVGGYFFIQQSFAKTDEEEITAAAQNIVQEKDEPKVEEVSNNPGASSSEPEMDEKRIQKYLHLMTHQKVAAKDKWGAIEMTPQNIENLMTIIKTNENYYQYADYYLEVLTQWQKGDFANAVEVHNYIWKLNGGTVGRATGLLDAEEEQAFISNHF
ncbi:hypothetical protein B0H99_12724 [Planomicrobium soli]|uniref:Uncharacterized protein n=1 Tax=Planomicrobium soli TaxID=1176648 RepID=A0A2P8FQL8_9BACL|nr:DUF6241 domain-containing protein [Planomicrobium soli]PSL24014.1 hypothetical protein B0H99_12724 [Planomicrobium soli]